MGRKFVCDWVFFRRRREFIGTTFFFGLFGVLFIYLFSLTLVSPSWPNFHAVSPRGELPFYLASCLLGFIFQENSFLGVYSKCSTDLELIGYLTGLVLLPIPAAWNWKTLEVLRSKLTYLVTLLFLICHKLQVNKLGQVSKTLSSMLSG